MKQTLHCQAGDHPWTREVKRGRKPINCPEHSAPVAASKPKTSSEDALLKARETKAQRAKEREQEGHQALLNSVASQQERVEHATKVNDKAYSLFTKRRSDKNFTGWHRTDGRLQGEIARLRALEARVG